jgi:hypothetical protein
LCISADKSTTLLKSSVGKSLIRVLQVFCQVCNVSASCE